MVGLNATVGLGGGYFHVLRPDMAAGIGKRNNWMKDSYFKKFSIIVIVARNPRSLSSFGGRLPLPGGMVLLFDGNSLG